MEWLLLAFIGLAFIFLLLPLGGPSFVEKALYFKNILIPGLVFFVGRNTNFEDFEVKRLFQVIFVIAISAFVVNVFEAFIGFHLQAFTGYALFNYGIYDMEPSGNFWVILDIRNPSHDQETGLVFCRSFGVGQFSAFRFCRRANLVFDVQKRRRFSIYCGHALLHGKFVFLKFKSRIWSFFYHVVFYCSDF